MNRLAPLLALLLVAGCARSEEASLIPPDSNLGYNQAGRVGAPERDDREPAIGQWRASLQENASALEFGPMGTEPLFSMLCTGRQSVLLQRHGGAPAGPLPELQLTVGETNVRLPVIAGGGAVAMLRAEAPLSHPIIAAMIAGGQPLNVGLTNDATPFILPASPLVRDYLRSCTQARPLVESNSAAGAPAAGPAPGNVTAPAANAQAPAVAANTAQPRQ